MFHDGVNYTALSYDYRAAVSASPDGSTWQAVGPSLEMAKLSDDYGSTLRFTGAMVGLCAQDVGGTHKPADFDYFSMREGIPSSGSR